MNAIIDDDVASILNANIPWTLFENATVLVTGGAGLLPAYMIEVLMAMAARKGFGPRKVLALVRNEEKARERFRHFAGRDDFALLVADVVFPPAIDGPVDVIIHAASIANFQQMMVDPVGTISANVLGTFNMLELARIKNSRSFLFFSSGEVCGQPQPHQIPMREDDYFPIDPTDIRSCYAESKRIGETMCAAWTKQFGLQTRIVRPFHTYGPGMNFAGGWVYTDFITDMLAGRALIIKSDGLGTRSFCYVADATLGYFTVMTLGKNAFPYNVGTGVETSIRDLAFMLRDEFKELDLSVVINDPSGPSAKPPPKRSAPDMTRLFSLGWRPHTTIIQGFRRTIESIGLSRGSGQGQHTRFSA